MPRLIHVTAVVLLDREGRVLLVRKRGTSMWMNPGGKPHPGESPADAGAREVRDELGLRLDPARLEYLGELRAAAANEADHVVVAETFRWPEVVAGDAVAPAAEIEALRWVGPAEFDGVDVAPLFTERIAPLLGGEWKLS